MQKALFHEIPKLTKKIPLFLSFHKFLLHSYIMEKLERHWFFAPLVPSTKSISLFRFFSFTFIYVWKNKFSLISDDNFCCFALRLKKQSKNDEVFDILNIQFSFCSFTPHLLFNIIKNMLMWDIICCLLCMFFWTLYSRKIETGNGGRITFCVFSLWWNFYVVWVT